MISKNSKIHIYEERTHTISIKKIIPPFFKIRLIIRKKTKHINQSIKITKKYIEFLNHVFKRM